MTRQLTAAVLMTSILLAGCTQSWKLIDQTQIVSENLEYSFNAPSGWLRQEHSQNEGESSSFMMLTRVGITTHKITIVRAASEKVKPKTHASDSNVPPSDLANMVIAGIKAKDRTGSFQLLSQQPATIDGHSGYRVHMARTDSNGLEWQVVAYGFIAGDRYYEIGYRAPTPNFFERDLPAFEHLVETFKLKKTSAN